MRRRAGYIGFNSVPAASALNSAASGMWALREAEAMRRAGTWPTTITIPGVPRDLGVSAGNGQVSVSWLSPVSNGGSPITDYVVQFLSDAGQFWTTFADGTSTSVEAVVTGLTNGVSHRFRVAAVNEVGTGEYTAESAAVTPGSSPLTVSPTTIVGDIFGNPQFTFTGEGTAGSKLSTGGSYRQARFLIETIDNHSFTCGVSGTLFFEWSTEDNNDGGEDIFNMTGFTRNGVASTTFAGSQTNISGTSKRGISVTSGDVIVWTTKSGLAIYAWTPLRAWIE